MCTRSDPRKVTFGNLRHAGIWILVNERKKNEKKNTSFDTVCRVKWIFSIRLLWKVLYVNLENIFFFKCYIICFHTYIYDLCVCTLIRKCWVLCQLCGISCYVCAWLQQYKVRFIGNNNNVLCMWILFVCVAHVSATFLTLCHSKSVCKWFSSAYSYRIVYKQHVIIILF